jgi:hypothetical protein
MDGQILLLIGFNINLNLILVVDAKHYSVRHKKREVP